MAKWRPAISIPSQTVAGGRSAGRILALRLLVIEDDPDLNRQLATALTDAGYVVDRAFDGEEGHYLGESEPYDAVILDIGLPKMDGISVLEAWRRAGRAMPVLILTARDRWSDKVQGFDAGADDYVAKPFHLEEVLARIRALLRRSAGHAKSELNCGSVRPAWPLPVLHLPARHLWRDKVHGFDAGADDYVAKPFHLEEVLARIRALLRRSAGHAKSELNCGSVRLDTRTGRVTVDGNPV